MIFYTADMHFGYEPILKLAGRPFRDSKEMDGYMIGQWNKCVAPDDSVYIVGDISLRHGEVPGEYLSKLYGHKHLIRGNHDTGLNHQEKFFDYVETVSDFLEIDDGDTHILLCHYPILYQKRGYMIHGHMHNVKNDIYRTLQNYPHVLNAGVDINGFSPVNLNQLIENNRRFYADEGLTIPETDYARQHWGWKADFRPLPNKIKGENL